MPKLDLTLTVPVVNNGLEKLILTAKNEGEDAKTKEIITRYSVALPGNRLSPMTVKIRGKDALSTIKDEDIVAGLANSKHIFVTLENCQIKFYVIDGNQILSAAATGIKVVQP
jgi:hypothetical protein